jgi:hypothetical protein
MNPRPEGHPNKFGPKVSAFEFLKKNEKSNSNNEK